MFSNLTAIPADPILGLMAAYHQDSNPKKIDLGIGVYKDELGNTPILKSVKKAEQFCLANETSKTYLGMAGNVSYNEKIKALIFAEHDVIAQNRARTVQTPGGTGALRVAAEFLRRCKGDATIWVSSPTWANHMTLFGAAGLTVKEYPYYDYDSCGLKFDEMMATLAEVKAGDIVLLHGCCHNPCGMDLNEAQWHQVADLAAANGFTPMIDLAYQGFGNGLDEDAKGVRIMASKVDEMLVCSSCSKNFGLYRERLGATTVVAKDATTADIAQSVILAVVRSIYSMPPNHGAFVVDTILSSDELRAMWHQELAEKRNRINGLRRLLVEKLNDSCEGRDFSFIETQHGMFSFLGITKEQVAALKSDYSIYMVDSSRMNVAGISQANIDYFAQSVAAVLK